MDYNGVLVGLGNPGSRYEGTRHNYGFAVVDALVDFAQRHGAAESLNGGKFSCELWRIRLKELGGVWLAAKPQTFMNLSGQSVQPLLAWHKLRPSDLVVAHDELDIPAGEMRFKLGGGNAGHNGLKSITELLGTPDFYRLRLGIGHPGDRNLVSAYVLNKPSAEDRQAIDESVAKSLRGLPMIMDGEYEEAVRFLHSS